MTRSAYFVALVVAFLYGVSAHAQQRLFVKNPSEVLELDTRAESLGTVLRRFPLPRGLESGGTVVVAGGRYLAWGSGTQRVAIFDTHSGVTNVYPLPSGYSIRASDAIRPRLIVTGFETNTGRFRETLVVLDGRSGQIRTVYPFDNSFAFGLAHVAYASRAEMIFTASLGSWYPGIAVFDANTGTPIVRYALSLGMSEHISQIIVDTSAQRLLVVVAKSNIASQEYRLLDALTGRVLATQTLLPGMIGPHGVQDTVLDETRHRLLTASGFGFVALSWESLAVIGVMHRSHFRSDLLPRGEMNLQLEYAPSASSLFVFDRTRSVAHGPFIPSVCVHARLTAINPETGNVVADSPLPDACGVDGPPFELVLIAGPEAPTLASRVLNKSVALSWSASPTATHYEVEAGSSPGLRDLAVFVVGGTSLSAEGVASGTYFVRVRALNAAKGPYSNELRIVVP